MILTCPNCGTQYVVKDDAVPPEGRQVRCAACKHSWHQDPETPTASEPEAGGEPEGMTEAAPAAEPPEEPASEDESLAEATMIDPRSGPEAEERAYEEAMVDEEAEAPAAEPPAAEPVAETQDASAPAPPEDWKEPPEAEPVPDVFSPFAAPGEEEPRRRSPLLSALIILILIAAAAAAFWFFAPVTLKARLGLATADSPLQLVMTNMVLQQLESGNQLLTLSGRVINPTNKEQDIPPLQARLRDPAGKVIYTWTINPPTRSLPAGGSASFNSAEVNVPAGGKDVVIAPGTPKA